MTPKKKKKKVMLPDNALPQDPSITGLMGWKYLMKNQWFDYDELKMTGSSSNSTADTLDYVMDWVSYSMVTMSICPVISSP